MKKLFIIVTSNNFPETMTDKQRYHQKCLEKGRRYYEKERLQKMVCDLYKALSEEEKNKKRQYGRSQYQNISEGKKIK